MSVENPTAGDSGASIEERLIAKFSAQPEQPAQTQASEANANEAAQAEQTEVPENGEQAEDSQPQLSTSELAKIFGLEESAFDVDSDGQPVIKTKIDGKEGAAKLSDLVKSYQLQGHAENRARAVAEQEKALQTRMQEVDQVFQQRLQHAESLANVAAQELMRDAQALEQSIAQHGGDPGQIAYAKMQIQERANRIQQAINGINAQKHHLEQKSEAAKQEAQRAELAKLPDVITDWKNSEVMEKEWGELRSWAAKHGYAPNTAMEVKLARDAMRWEKQQQNKPAIENKVRTAPKIVKPGTPTKETAETRLNDLKQNVKKTGGKNGTVEQWLIARGIA